MKKFFISIWLIFIIVDSGVGICSDLENVLKGVLDIIPESKIYIFRPGEKIYSKMEEKLYYSGSEYTGNRKVLLLTYIENGIPILLKFPEPDIIQIKNVLITNS